MPRLRQIVLLGILLAAPTYVTAHEMGAMKVTTLFTKDGHYEIDVAFDPTHTAPGQPATAADPQSVMERLSRDMRVGFDGDPVKPEALPSSGGGIYKFRGAVPAGTGAFTWSYASISGQYLLGSRNEGDTATVWQWIQGPATSRPIELLHAPPPLTRAQVIVDYLRLGYTHILPGGIDHILFVLGLFLLSLRRKVILMQITAFTIAHSITLGLTIYGVVSLSPKIVEPLIAVSIVYVGVENLLLREAGPRRLAIVFCFGLLHGMGFAGVLKELGLPRSEFLTALASFNVGVELGQLTVVTIAFLAFGAWFKSKPWYRSYLTNPASALIAVVALYWTVQRVFF